MTAKFSLNSLSAKNMKRAVADNKKLMIVTCILQVLGIPMIIGAAMLELWQESLEAYDYHPVIDVEMYVVIGAFCLSAAVLVGMIAAISVFQELWKRTKVDMLYSLPLTGSQRFFSHFMAGSVVYLLPYLIAVVLGWIILVGGSFAIDFSSPYLGMTHAEFLGEACRYYLLASLGLFLLMALYYATTVLITVCCGTLFESIYTTLLLNCLVPGTFAAVLGVFCDSISGFSFEYLWQQPIGYTSPVGGLIYLIFLLSDSEIYSMYPDGWSVVGSQASDHGMIPAFIRWAIVLTVIIAAVIAAAWYLYKRRLAESVSKPYVYQAVYYIMLTAVTVLILCLLNADVVGPALLMSAIFYFIMEVVRKRGFKKFWLSAITYGVTVALTIGMFAAVIGTNAFGTVYRIPAASTVSSVVVDIQGLYGDGIQLEYTDKDTIKAIQEIHRDIASDMKTDHSTTEAINERIRELDYRILDYSELYDFSDFADYRTIDPESLNETEVYNTNFKHNNVWYSTYEGTVCGYAEDFYLELLYYTHAGTTVHRGYYINTDQYLNLLNTLYETELFAEASADRMEKRLNEHYAVYDQYSGTYQEKEVITLTLANSQATQTQYAYNGDADIRKLRDAYYNDLKKMTAEDFLQSGLFGYLNDIPIWYTCTETIELLRSYGFWEFNAPEVFNFPDIQNPYYFVDNYTQFSYDAVPLRVRIYAPGDYIGCGEEYKTYPSNYNYVKEGSELFDHTYFCSTYDDISEKEPQLFALLSALNPMYISTEECYMVIVNGVWYAVPPEYESLVHELVLFESE